MGVLVVSVKKQESDPTMTQYKSAVTTLIGDVLADPGLAHSDVFRRTLQAGLQDPIDAEATARIGVAPHKRTPERTTGRNGTRPKALATPAGEVELAIPKPREGSFFPSLLSPRRRVDKALYAVVCLAWVDGASTRKVDQLVRALGNESGISRSTVSRICSEIDEGAQGTDGFGTGQFVAVPGCRRPPGRVVRWHRPHPALRRRRRRFPAP